jgi:hypothetical protein
MARTAPARRFPLAGLGVALLAVLGCGGSDGPATHPVTGKVVFKGSGDLRRLVGGHVYFESVGEPKVTAAGEIEAGGAFTLGSYLDGKDRAGVPPGEYRVSVKPPADDAPRPPVHPKYLNPATSGLKVTVAAGTNTPTIEVEAGR